MDDEAISLIVKELASLIIARAPGKIFQLGKNSLAIDFGLRDAGYLFISVDPALPRLYLCKRKVRDLEKQSRPLTQFALSMKKELTHARLVSIEKDIADRIVRFTFAGEDDLGNAKTRRLMTQLTGRSANVLLIDDAKQIIQTLRSSKVAGQQAGQTYQNPDTPAGSKQKMQSDLVKLISSGKFQSPSEAADHYFTGLLAEKENAARIASARAGMRRKISQQQKLLKQLENDLCAHELPEQHKRIGDLLLANLSTATRNGDDVTLIDYFAEGAPTIRLEIDASASLPEEAARRFARYSRSKRAITQIESRIELVQKHLSELQAEQQLLERQIADGQGVAVESLPSAIAGGTAVSSPQSKGPPDRVPGTRRYVSSDGLEILVGRTSKDNDNLTVKIAKPNDLWLHAADYGGSHVVVRNSTRKEIPQRTLIEAAQLAAYFSQAKKDPKVDVHYTERKFVTKPKGAKLGLVRLARFRNITVVPKEAGTRM